MPNYPRLETYIASLPNGLESYPEYQCKGSIVRQSFEILPKASFPTPYPPAIADWFTTEPHVSAWIPEVRSNALFLAIADQCRDEQEFESKILAMNRGLLSGPLYRILLLVVSPSILLRQAETRWAAFHRGIALRVRDLEKHRVTIALEYPPKLMPPLVARAYTTAFQAACELAGGRDVKFVPRTVTDSIAVFDGRWG